MNDQLFRKQAIDAQDKLTLGSLQIQHMPFQSFIVLVVFILCAGVLMFVFLATYTNKATVKGVLQTKNGVSKVHADIEGTIKALYVKEGDRVHEGQALLIIEPEISSRDKLNINEELTSILESQKIINQEESNNLDQKRKALLTAYKIKRQSLEAELDKLKDELSINDQQIKVQNSIKQKLETLLAKDFVSSLDYQTTEKELLNLKLARSRLERQLISFQQSLVDAQNTVTIQTNEFETQALDLQKQVATLEKQGLQHNSNKGRLIISPADGYVTNVLVHNSQLATAKSELLTITPLDDQLLASLYIPTQSSGLIKATQTVNLRIDAFPYQKYGSFKGRISSISKAPISTPDSYANKDGIFLARVNLMHQSLMDGEQELSLRPGMQLEADIVLDERRVLDLIFDPVRRVIQKI